MPHLWGGDFGAQLASEHMVGARHGNVGESGSKERDLHREEEIAGNETTRSRPCHRAVSTVGAAVTQRKK